MKQNLNQPNAGENIRGSFCRNPQNPILLPIKYVTCPTVRPPSCFRKKAGGWMQFFRQLGSGLIKAGSQQFEI
jgi:hypothetical protein